MLTAAYWRISASNRKESPRLFRSLQLIVNSFTGSEMLAVAMICVTFAITGIGVIFFINAGVRWESMQKLLKESEFSARSEEEAKLKETVSGIYWPIVVALYLGWSFLSGDWHITRAIRPLAGVLFAAVMKICSLLRKN